MVKQNSDLENIIFTNRGPRVIPEFENLKSKFSKKTVPPGVTVSSQLRRRPNCFNLLHQCEVLMRGGYTGDNAVSDLEAGFLYAYILETF